MHKGALHPPRCRMRSALSQPAACAGIYDFIIAWGVWGVNAGMNTFCKLTVFSCKNKGLDMHIIMWKLPKLGEFVLVKSIICAVTQQ